jgi:MraZ protein
MFRGNHTVKVDEKGRLKLPAAFKQLFDAQHVAQFYITSPDGTSAEIWPLPEWEKQEALLAEFSTMDTAVAKYLNLTSYYGQQVEIDSEVAVMGKINHLEVHNLAQFEQNLPANALTQEDRRSIAAILSRNR